MSELGQRFKQVRESKNLSIEDVARETRIKPDFIEAIEAGEFDRLPGEVFAKGFIRNYALFLGLDPTEMLSLYREEIAPSEEEPGPTEEAPPLTTELPVGGASRWPAILKNALLPLLVALAVGVAAWMVLTRPPLPVRMPGIPFGRAAATATPTPEPSPTVEATTLAPSPTPTAPEPGHSPEAIATAIATAIPTPTPTATPSPTPSAPAERVILNLKGIKHTWLEVSVNGEFVFRNFIEPGDSLVWSGKRIYVKIGNAGGVRVVVNGQDLGIPGEEGEVLHLEWTAGSIEPKVLTPTPAPEATVQATPEATPTPGA